MEEGEGEGEGDDTIGEYDGERNKDKQRHGKGKTLLPNSDYFEGFYKEGHRHGEGHYVFKGGAQYKGNYKEGTKDGFGVFFYPDGSKYEGEWKDDKRNGKGLYTYSQGDTYDGDWENDERHGLGTYTYKLSNVILSGIWKKGKMEGKGKIIYPNFTFYGRFIHNMPIGKGCFVFENYCIQEGHYVQVKDNKINNEEEEVVGGGREEEDEKMSLKEGYPKGVIPMWRPKKILPYSPDLIPQDPKLPIKPPPTVLSVEELEVYEDMERGESDNNEENRKSSTGLVQTEELLNDAKEESDLDPTAITEEEGDKTSLEYTGESEAD